MTLIRRPCWPYTEKDIPHEIAVENCQPRDLMSTVLDKAITIDSSFSCGIRMRIFIPTDEGGETELIAFHPSVENMMLCELGILASNNVIRYTQLKKVRY